jgi:hypothetical protein
VSVTRPKIEETASALARSLYVPVFFKGVQQLYYCFFGAVLVEPDGAFVFGGCCVVV